MRNMPDNTGWDSPRAWNPPVFFLLLTVGPKSENGAAGTAVSSGTPSSVGRRLLRPAVAPIELEEVGNPKSIHSEPEAKSKEVSIKAFFELDHYHT
jgi:hypothetical protein